PKAIYDPVADRFILVFLNGSTTTTSRIVICFSASNNPTGTWYFYTLNGNPNNDTTWSDYPAVSLTDSELFITVNSIIPNQPWQTGFAQTLAWQIDKQAGYNGDSTMTSELWTNIKYNGTMIRYLCPVNGGSKPYGPHMYFLSNRNFGIQNDSIWLIEITGSKNDTNTKVTVQQVT